MYDDATLMYPVSSSIAELVVWYNCKRLQLRINYAKVHNDYEIVFSDLKMPMLAKTPKTKSVRISTQNY